MKKMCKDVQVNDLNKVQRGKEYHAEFSADMLPTKTENKFRDILMLWAQIFQEKAIFVQRDSAYGS